MLPESRFITIAKSEEKVKNLLNDLFITPRQRALYWSKITLQTPNMKVGYPGQHLVSLVTGVTGERSGARGNDLQDGSEIKSCSRVDQVDKCKNCKQPVLRIEDHCLNCFSDNIQRNNDSKWLFTIRSENDLKILTDDMNRVILIIADYPGFSEGNFDDIRFEIFEIWPNSPRCSRFSEIMSNYYYNIYNEHKTRDSRKTPAPKNFWPESFQFYLCNPIKIFSATVKDSVTSPDIIINKWISPEEDRSNYTSSPMPFKLLNKHEIEMLAKEVPLDILKQNNKDLLHITDPMTVLSKTETLNETVRSYLDLREDSHFTLAQYARRKN